MDKKIFAVVVMLVLLTVLFAGCNMSDNSSDNGSAGADGLGDEYKKFIGTWNETIAEDE